MFDEAHVRIGAEVHAVHTVMGLSEVNGANRLKITGANRPAYLDRLCCGHVGTGAARVARVTSAATRWTRCGWRKASCTGRRTCRPRSHPSRQGFHRFVRSSKAFHGKAGLLAPQRQGPCKRLVTRRHDAPDRRATSCASRMPDDGMLGTVTSVASGFRTGPNLAPGVVDPVHATPGTRMPLDLGPAEVIPPSPFDPAMARPRG